MNTKEISAIIVEKMTEVHGSYDSVHPDVNKNFEKNRAANPEAYSCGPCNWSYIDCADNADLLKFVLTHPEFSHFTHRLRYSVTVYWHHDTAPNCVISVAAFDPKYMQEASRIIAGEIGAALAWADGYETERLTQEDKVLQALAECMPAVEVPAEAYDRIWKNIKATL